MAHENPITVEDCLKASWQALLRGDLKERDRLCDLAKLAFTGGQKQIPSDTPLLGTEGATKQ